MRIARLILNTLEWVKARVYGVYWLTQWMRYRVKYKKYYIPLSEKESYRPMIILANGPSLKDDFPNVYSLVEETGSSVAVVNHFALSPHFKKLKPQYYLIADRVFFWERTDEKNSAIYKVLNNDVDWPMQFIIPIQEKRFVENKITNPNITIVPLCILLYSGPNRYKYWVYKKGISVPSFVNISVMALYYALNMGAKEIYLYGVDHTFLREITVDDQNRLCSFDKHFYGNEMRIIPPKNDGTILRMKDFVYDKYLTFVEHDNIRGYADYLGAEIINCTRCSCIDSYTRLTQIDNLNNIQ